MSDSEFDFVVIGGGPAGAMASLTLSGAGYSVCLIERRSFPRETLCGEFLSHEVTSILRDIGIEKEFLALSPTPISSFALCPEQGPIFSDLLGFPAYGLKRGAFDQLLLNTAASRGVRVLQPADAESVVHHKGGFEVHCRLKDSTKTLASRWCIGAYGKSTPLDKQLLRSFVGTRSQLNGIKFHVPSKMLEQSSAHEIRIFTGPGMYCGINHVDSGTATICFLERRGGEELSPRARLRELASANQHFAGTVRERLMQAIEAAPIYGAGNIYFGKRNVVENGMFMVGDAARVISPLAGDGIGMALQSAQLLGTLFREHRGAESDSKVMEGEYRRRWERMFTPRLRAAAAMQRVLLSGSFRGLGMTLLSFSPSLLQIAINLTRGRID
jgi:flavin-dependent dehydrogenase